MPLLRSINWDKLSVYAIVIEMDHNAPDEVSEIHAILSGAGFELVGLLAGDAIWVRPSALENSAGHWVRGNITGCGMPPPPKASSKPGGRPPKNMGALGGGRCTTDAR